MDLGWVLLFAIVFIAVQLCDKKSIRVAFAGITIIALVISEYALEMQRVYGRGILVVSVRKLAEISPAAQREELMRAARNFSKDYRRESIYSMKASYQLMYDIKEADKSSSKENQPVGDVAPE